MKNQHNLKCIDCGLIFEWTARLQQLLAAKNLTPKRCASCRRAKREQMQKARRVKSRRRREE